MDTDSLNTAIVTLAPDAPTELLLEFGDKLDSLQEKLKEMRRVWENHMIDRINAEGAIKNGDILYRVGYPPTTKCVNLAGAVEAVLTTVGGDFEAFCAHLSANALKHGQCSKTLPPEKYAELFQTDRKAELQADEATPRRLSKTNLAFCR